MNATLKLIWLDDERDPALAKWHACFPVPNAEIVWLTSFEQFVTWIQHHGLPAAICFDHDLGDGPSGLDAAKWLTNYCLDQKVNLPDWNIQSANPVGSRNIRSLLTTFERCVDSQ